MAGLHAFSTLVKDTDSECAAEKIGSRMRRAFATQPLKALIVYVTVNHDAATILRRLRAHVGPDVCLVGCSVQGAAVRGEVREGGFQVAAMGLGGGDLRVSAGLARDLPGDTKAKGEVLASGLVRDLTRAPKYTFLCWDPQSGADIELLLDGFRRTIHTPVAGGAAGQPFGRIHRTYQYFGDEVTSHAAVVLGLDGPFDAEVGVSGGTSPTGVVMEVTRSDGARVLEIDGRPALEVWREVTGYAGASVDEQDYLTSWAVGVAEHPARTLQGSTSTEVVRMTIGFDTAANAIVLPTPATRGSRLSLHRRTAEAIVDGSRAMASHLAARVEGRRPWAVFAFECCARMSPFLGNRRALEENLDLQTMVAPRAPWLGMMAWGEVAPVGGVPAFQNFAYPLVVLAA